MTLAEKDKDNQRTVANMDGAESTLNTSTTTSAAAATTSNSTAAFSTGMHTPTTSELQRQTLETEKLSHELENTLPGHVDASLSLNDPRPVFYFDVDNCLYSKSTKVADMMGKLIEKYFKEKLNLSHSDAELLHTTYYKDYGLALEGLIRHHQIDPLDYNAKVDDALPLEKLIAPVSGLRELLLELKNAGQCRLWLFTNAYVNHGRRVVKLLGIEDLFEGITYCDYSSISPLICKPKPEMYQKAMVDAGFGLPIKTEDLKKCYFVDDSYINCVGASSFGWENTVHFVEEEEHMPEKKACRYVVRHLQELRRVFPHLFSGEKSRVDRERSEDR